MPRLDGQRALVTGASRGIGRAIAEAYAEEGARLALVGIDPDGLEAVADAVPTEAHAIECDVRDTDAVEAAVAEAVEAFGGLDVVVNNAGVIVRATLLETDDAEMEQVVDVNLQGTMRVARAALPHLADAEGALVNVASQLAEVAVPGAAAYVATKGGVASLTRALALEHADDGVRVNALAPGVVDTDMTEQGRQAVDNWEADRLERIPLDRLGEPEDVAGPAVFLASDEAGYVTGHVLVVDGGYVAR